MQRFSSKLRQEATMTMTAHKKNAIPSETRSQELPSAQERQFETVFLANWSQVYGFLLRLVGDQAEAEDLALETFLRLYQRPPGRELAGDVVEEAGRPIGGWLHRVAANLGLNALRGWKRRQRYEMDAGRSDLWERQQYGPERNPAELFQAEEERQHTRRILGEMNSRQSRLLILRHSGLAYKEIAAELGVAATSIGPLLVRAEEDFERRYRAASLDGANAPEEEDHASD